MKIYGVFVPSVRKPVLIYEVKPDEHITVLSDAIYVYNDRDYVLWIRCENHTLWTVMEFENAVRKDNPRYDYINIGA